MTPAAPAPRPPRPSQHERIAARRAKILRKMHANNDETSPQFREMVGKPTTRAEHEAYYRRQHRLERHRQRLQGFARRQAERHADPRGVPFSTSHGSGYYGD